VIVQGDCLTVLPTLDACSFDAIVTDPPAGIAFMGKSWDKDKGGRDHWVAWMAKVAAECLRVVKPGAHALVWALPRTSHWTATAWEDGGWEVRDRVSFIFGTGFPKSLNLDGGLGTALKPALEDWWLMRKPLVGTVAANVEQFGTGALNVNACRIETDSPRPNRGKHSERPESGSASSFDLGSGHVLPNTSVGRWPANLITDGSAEIAAMFPQTITGSGNKNPNGSHSWEGGPLKPTNTVCDGDTGSASRFFYGAKATRADREEGLEAFLPKQRDDSRKDGNPGGNNPRNRGLQPRRNTHATVKSTSLMRYLCKLITPAGGHILDPFAGSGSTGKAAALERYRFTGIEQDADFCEIARARIAWAEAHRSPEQLSLLGEAI